VALTDGLPDIKRVGVLGAGQMGGGIAQVTAQAGFEVVLCEVDQAALERGLEGIDHRLARAVKRGRSSDEEAQAARQRIRGTVSYDDLRDTDLVIEAVTESLEVKLGAWRRLDRCVRDGAILATNTSSISVVDLAAATERPERVIGLHFFYPVSRMGLLEVVQTVMSAREAVEAGIEFGRRLGKHTVLARDTKGFIVNRLLVPYLLDAIRAYENKVGSIEEIDEAMRLGAGYPMGPFTLLDFVGLDTTKAIADIMWDEYRETRFAAPPTLRRLVSAGYFGRKSGKGFYDYSGDRPVPLDPLAL
jgi:3-hydroxybutyryl-CoA dehydrogenase